MIDEYKRDVRQCRGSGLVAEHLDLAMRAALKYARRLQLNESDANDLIQEANLGLVVASTAFDKSRGVRFTTYAAFWIRAYVLKFLRDNHRLVRIATTNAHKKAFYAVARAVDIELDEIAKKAGVSIGIVRMMNERMHGNDVPLTELKHHAGGPNPEQMCIRSQALRLLREEVDCFKRRIGDRGADVLDSRLLTDEPQPRRLIAERHGVSGEAIRQLEAKITLKLQKNKKYKEIAEAMMGW